MFTALSERRVTLSFLLVMALFFAGATTLFPVCAKAGQNHEASGISHSAGPGVWLAASRENAAFTEAEDRDPTLNGSRQKKNGAAPARERNGEAPVSKQMLGGSMVGAVVFGYPFEGLGIVDLLALTVLIALGLKIFARTRRERDREDTTSVPHNQDYHRNTDQTDTGKGDAPAGRNLWARKNEQEKTGETLWGKNPQSPPSKPDTMQNRADNMWAHLRSAPPPRAPGSVASGAEVPDDFRIDDFLNGARTLYTRLQVSWAARDLDDLVPFTSPGMMQVIRDHAAHDPTPTTVEVLLVNASLASVKREGDEESASVIFNALMREGDAGEPTEARELWHFARNRNTGGMWRLDGIEQVQQG